ncbi:hypothetical protein [Neglectibacter caecimuris]|uniref:hypothetical protein n=1 Tax=Neglectibacter caecimuris TaxID=3093658 RepID=UPI002AC97936|nr:hypothetical protein [Neglectibacter sp. M00184]
MAFLNSQQLVFDALENNPAKLLFIFGNIPAFHLIFAGERLKMNYTSKSGKLYG